jgi:hypothetical protein
VSTDQSRTLSTSEQLTPDSDELTVNWNRVIARRSSLKGMGVAGVAAGTGGALLASGGAASASAGLTDGGAAILRFLVAAELIESDLWAPY